jgi:3',5'-nucleoside bisphosphate phosphatase
VRGIDLHTHSTCSDGTTTPAQTVALAVAEHLDGIALTDHDTMDGWDEAAQACASSGLRFVPGVELSTELGGRSIHLLGYFVDPRYHPLQAECDRLRNERLRRAEAMVAKLVALGVDIGMDDVLARAGTAPVGRPHIAAAMVAMGAVPDLDAAFDGYLEDGGPAYVTKHALAPTDGVSLIRDAGGVAVLAHPGVSTRDAPVDLGLLDQLVSVGLQGVEADHAGHDEPTRNYWRQAARERTLYVTGSSDFHGTRKEAVIGEATTDVAVVDALEEMAGAPVTAAKKETPW